jgi:hypothetical protein
MTRVDINDNNQSSNKKAYDARVDPLVLWVLTDSGEKPKICNNLPVLSTFLVHDYLITLHFPLGIAKPNEIKLHLNIFGM